MHVLYTMMKDSCQQKVDNLQQSMKKKKKPTAVLKNENQFANETEQYMN